MKGNWKTIILYLLIISLAIGLCLALWSSKQDAKEITYGEAVELFKDNKVVEFKITSGNVLQIKTTEQTEAGTPVVCEHKLRDVGLFMYDVDEYVKAQLALPEADRTLKIEKWDIEALKETSWLIAFLPGIILAVVVIIFYVYMINKAGDNERRMNAFGKAKVKMPSKEKNRKFFSDVAGCDE